MLTVLFNCWQGSWRVPWLLHQHTKNVLRDCLWSMFFRGTECKSSSTIVQLPTLLQHTVDFSANETYCFLCRFLLLCSYLFNHGCDLSGTLIAIRKEGQIERKGDKNRQQNKGKERKERKEERKEGRNKERKKTHKHCEFDLSCSIYLVITLSCQLLWYLLVTTLVTKATRGILNSTQHMQQEYVIILNHPFA